MALGNVMSDCLFVGTGAAELVTLYFEDPCARTGIVNTAVSGSDSLCSWSSSIPHQPHG